MIGVEHMDVVSDAATPSTFLVAVAAGRDLSFLSQSPRTL